MRGSAWTLIIKRSLKYAARSRVKTVRFLPESLSVAQSSTSSLKCPSIRQLAILKRKVLSTVPVICSTVAGVMSSSFDETNEIWSRSDRASRNAPSERDAMSLSASSSIFMPTLSETSLKRATMPSTGMRLNS